MVDEATHTCPRGEAAGGFGRVTPGATGVNVWRRSGISSSVGFSYRDRHVRRQAVLDCHVAPAFAAPCTLSTLAYAVN